ncbi:hypothetical protein EGW08_009927 [Elysia chlorotica]|uniref:Uncharacterized protein n=1 Tax=Elysia chlorotica TaxID=188477 RepID=A0A433TL92_ELYCH|nr:hypothetical protein EGW08_009927 [Elysia chlorotica]
MCFCPAGQLFIKGKCKAFKVAMIVDTASEPAYVGSKLRLYVLYSLPIEYSAFRVQLQFQLHDLRYQLYVGDQLYCTISYLESNRPAKGTEEFIRGYREKEKSKMRVNFYSVFRITVPESKTLTLRAKPLSPELREMTVEVDVRDPSPCLERMRISRTTDCPRLTSACLNANTTHVTERQVRVGHSSHVTERQEYYQVHAILANHSDCAKTPRYRWTYYRVKPRQSSDSACLDFSSVEEIR